MKPVRLFRRLVLLEEGEAPALLWSSAYFFLLLFGFYLAQLPRGVTAG